MSNNSKFNQFFTRSRIIYTLSVIAMILAIILIGKPRFSYSYKNQQYFTFKNLTCRSVLVKFYNCKNEDGSMITRSLVEFEKNDFEKKAFYEKMLEMDEIDSIPLPKAKIIKITITGGRESSSIMTLATIINIPVGKAEINYCPGRTQIYRLFYVKSLVPEVYKQTSSSEEEEE